MAGGGASLNHISRESTDINRLAKFYQEVCMFRFNSQSKIYKLRLYVLNFYGQIFGFEEVESPKFAEFKVVWLRLPSSSLYLHLIERNPSNNLPEGPWSAASPVKDPSHLPRGHHLCFSVPNLQSFIHTLKVSLFFIIVYQALWVGNDVKLLKTEWKHACVCLMQDKGIETFEKSLPDGKIKQVFFFDPDGKTK